MSFLSPFFKSEKKPKPSATKSSESLPTDEVSLETLKELIPIRNFGEDKLIAFAMTNKAELIKPKQTIFTQGEVTEFAVYLLKGTVVISDKATEVYEIVAGTPKAKFPISSGAVFTTTAVSKTDISILKVPQSIMATRKTDADSLHKLKIPDEHDDNRLLHLFSDHLTNQNLEIPSLPAIAIQLRKAIQKDIGIAEAVQIIQLDPVISGKLIEVANCPLFRTGTPAKTCISAVNRIGLKATQSLVTSISIQSIFKTKSKLIQQHLDHLWKQSLYISMLCSVLASVTKQADPDEALLAGLISDIGTIPFLHFISNIPQDYYSEAELAAALPIVKGLVGYKVLVDWGFSEEFLDIPLNSENWYQNSSDKLNLTDIVVLSRLHSKIGSANMADYPPIASIPAAGKLKNFELSPEFSLKILHEAKVQINETLKAFTH